MNTSSLKHFLLRMALATLLAAGLVATSASAERNLRMSTTTSTQHSGLLAHILPLFEKAYAIQVDVVAVGSGKALELGRNGDVDVMLVHAPEAEKRSVAEGYGIERHPVMYNEFLLVGPQNDPAGIRGDEDVLNALRRIAKSNARFVSRGDNSGTEMKEQSFWKKIGTRPSGSSYISAGQGMGQVLAMAAEMGAYTLTDRATYARFTGKDELDVMVEGDSRLFNPYSVIAVNPEHHPDVDHKAAMIFIEWLTSVPGQQAIASFRRNGEQLFVPSAHTSGPSYARQNVAS